MNIKQKLNGGFTVIELIVVMAVSALLVLLGALAYNGYTQQAKFTQLQCDSRLLTDACERYFLDVGDYPRISDVPYTSGKVNSFAAKVYDHKGAVVVVDSSGSYYDIDFMKLKRYVTIKEDYKNFILQNPVGEVYFLDPKTNKRVNPALIVKPDAPTVTVDCTDNPAKYTVTYPTGITPSITQYQIDGGAVVTAVPTDLLSVGTHSVKVRYCTEDQVFSNWASASFTIINGVKEVAVGDHHTLALMDDGTVRSWGHNDFGQLGYSTNLGTDNPNPTPAAIPGLSSVKQVYAGNCNSFALLQDGTVMVWGYNFNGQLGIAQNSGTTNALSTPTAVQALSNVKEISTCQTDTAVLLEDGTVKMCGVNLYGELGNAANIGTNNANSTFTVVSGLSGVKHIYVGQYHTAALLNDGSVKAWGWNKYGQLGTNVNVSTDTANYTPLSVTGLTGVQDLSVGLNHTLALMGNGTVKACGWNLYGQTGSTTNAGNNTANPTPTVISSLSNVTHVSAGGNGSAAVMSDGSVKMWGYNYYGELGNSRNNNTVYVTTTPTLVSGLSAVKQISMNTYHTVALMSNKSVAAWGENRYGELGTSYNSGYATPNPTPIIVTGLN